MYIVYPKQIQFNVINDEKEELIGYAERHIGDDDFKEFRIMEDYEIKRQEDLINLIDEEYAYKIISNK